MSKSVYSLVLSDEVVAALDRQAAANNMSRSAFADKVLAEYTNIATTRQRRQEVFDLIGSLLMPFEHLEILPYRSGADSMFINSPIPYRYRPTARYGVRTKGDGIGTLTVSFRAKHPDLMGILSSFYYMWTQMEDERGYMWGRSLYDVGDDGGYTRTFYQKRELPVSSDTVAAGMLAYIRAFDGALRECCEGDGITGARLRGWYDSFDKAADNII